MKIESNDKRKINLKNKVIITLPYTKLKLGPLAPTHTQTHADHRGAPQVAPGP